MPRFLKTLSTVALQVTGGSPGANKLLASDSLGVGTWTLVSDANVSASASISPSKLNADELALQVVLAQEVYG